MLATLALSLTSLMAADMASWTGDFSCLGDDTSEIFDRDRSRGHDYFDLDGDTSDPATTFGMRIEPTGLLVQNVFTNRATPAWTRFRIVETKRSARHQSIVGLAYEDVTDRPQTIVVMRDENSGKFGLVMSTGRFSIPAMRDGEAFVSVHLRMAHCTKR